MVGKGGSGQHISIRPFYTYTVYTFSLSLSPLFIRVCFFLLFLFSLSLVRSLVYAGDKRVGQRRRLVGASRVCECVCLPSGHFSTGLLSCLPGGGVFFFKIQSVVKFGAPTVDARCLSVVCCRRFIFLSPSFFIVSDFLKFLILF